MSFGIEDPYWFTNDEVARIQEFNVFFKVDDLDHDQLLFPNVGRGRGR